MNVRFRSLNRRSHIGRSLSGMNRPMTKLIMGEEDQWDKLQAVFEAAKEITFMGYATDCTCNTCVPITKFLEARDAVQTGQEDKQCPICFDKITGCAHKVPTDSK